MKLSDIESKNLKEGQPEELEGDITHDIIDILEDEGITMEMLVDTALALYAPHPGIETRELAEEKFLEELYIALSDPNLCMLVYAGVLLERGGAAGTLPNTNKGSYEKDRTFLVGG